VRGAGTAGIGTLPNAYAAFEKPCGVLARG
jgi:hypothetical protein